jgi:hypothetical protein
VASTLAGARRAELVDLPSDDLDEFQVEAIARGWSDGLPLIPPTPPRVEAMLGGTDRAPHDVVGLLPTSYGECTIERIAIAAVMAGCRPEYLPVLVTAFEAICDPQFSMLTVQATTHPVGVAVYVNGPIARHLGINAAAGAFGPGNRANATIGRAVRLVQQNVGGAVPGVSDMSTQGSPLKFGMCVAENEAASPWEPFHVSRGFDADESVVTVHAAEAPNEINDSVSADARGVLVTFAETIASMGANNSYSIGAEYVVALGPEHAGLIADAGFSRRDLQEYLYERARIPYRVWKQGGCFGFIRTPQWTACLDDDAMVPMSSSPDRIKIFVVGGAGRHSVWMSGMSSLAVSQRIELADGSAWRPSGG